MRAARRSAALPEDVPADDASSGADAGLAARFEVIEQW